jgi:hypothetical protein
VSSVDGDPASDEDADPYSDDDKDYDLINRVL